MRALSKKSFTKKNGILHPRVDTPTGARVCPALAHPGESSDPLAQVPISTSTNNPEGPNAKKAPLPSRLATFQATREGGLIYIYFYMGGLELAPALEKALDFGLKLELELELELDGWYMIHGTWYMVHSPWYIVHGTWYIVHGVTWYMVHGVTWYMVHATWYMVHSTWYMVHVLVSACACACGCAWVCVCVRARVCL